MLLAGLILKLGTFGVYRFLIFFFSVNNFFFYFLGLCGAIICPIICMFQRDSKSLAAYSSVTHINFLFIGFLLLSGFSSLGSFISILSHGFTSTLIFFFIGEFYHFSGSRIIYFINSYLNSLILFSIF